MSNFNLGFYLIIAGLGLSMIGFSVLAGNISNRIYPDRDADPLVTQSQVKNYIPAQAESDLIEGYYFNEKGEKIESSIYEDAGDKIKVFDKEILEDNVNLPFAYNLDGTTSFVQRPKRLYTWIPKKDFQRYYDLKELSEIVNKTKKR